MAAKLSSAQTGGDMSDAVGLSGLVTLDEIVPASKPWGHVVRKGEILRLVDLGRPASRRFPVLRRCRSHGAASATHTVKVQGNIYIGKDTMLYSDRGAAFRIGVGSG
jgi:uncharacterized protein